MELHMSRELYHQSASSFQEDGHTLLSGYCCIKWWRNCQGGHSSSLQSLLVPIQGQSPPELDSQGEPVLSTLSVLCAVGFSLALHVGSHVCQGEEWVVAVICCVAGRNVTTKFVVH